ncbi:MAG TPA: MOSC domain-containing protein, partial [Planctomycetaceae bacterium]|nr:MOSC domain-containing protein [Planctomycetaceae bacterium]
MQTIAELLEIVPQVGRVTWIGASARRRSEITPLDRVELLDERGLQADYHAKSGRSKRQVTLIQTEHLAVIGSLLAREPIPPELLRRN